MTEENHAKTQAMAVARHLQKALKTASMYSVDHSAAASVLGQAFTALNTLLKETKRLTIGFPNQRVLLNNILTSDRSLTHLELEFSKRGIAAVTFEAGMTLKEFKRGVRLLVTQPRIVAENGGIKPLLERNPLEGMAILPAEKTGGQAADTVLEMDAESYLMAQTIGEPQPLPTARGLEQLLHVSGLEQPAGGGGSAGEVLAIAGKAAVAGLVDSKSDPSQLAQALARTLEELSPQTLFSQLPADKEKEFRGQSPQELATDLMEDWAAEWAMQRLAAAPPGRGAAAVEAEVVWVLARGLQATQLAERLLQKLARFLEEANLPAEVYSRIRQGLVWFSLSEEEKHAQLMQLERFDPQQFIQLVSYARDMLEKGKIDKAIQVTEHYFSFLDVPAAEVQAEDLARAPELLQAIAGLQTLEFIRKLAARLSTELLDEKHLNWECHQQMVNCLVTLAQSAALYEDFEVAHRIGAELERSLAAEGAQHKDCCGQALGNLLTPAAVERLIELYLEKRGDIVCSHTVTAVLKMIGPLGSEKGFQLLEEEPSAANRMRLIRLIETLGPIALEAARKRLADGRWYVVRNACYVVGDLRDPEPPAELRAALSHADVRVQQAAVTAVVKSQSPSKAVILSEALPHLQAHVLEMALDELMFLKDPTSVDGLEQLLASLDETRAGVLEKLIQLLAVLPCERAVELLGKVSFDTGQMLPIRRAALEALRHSSFPVGQRLLGEFVDRHPTDPLAVECQQNRRGSAH